MKTIKRGASNTLIVSPISYGYSFINKEETIKVAVELIKNGTDIIMIEGAGLNIGKIEN